MEFPEIALGVGSVATGVAAVRVQTSAGQSLGEAAGNWPLLHAADEKLRVASGAYNRAELPRMQLATDIHILEHMQLGTRRPDHEQSLAGLRRDLAQAADEVARRAPALREAESGVQKLSVLKNRTEVLQGLGETRAFKGLFLGAAAVGLGIAAISFAVD